MKLRKRTYAMIIAPLVAGAGVVSAVAIAPAASAASSLSCDAMAWFKDQNNFNRVDNNDGSKRDGLIGLINLENKARDTFIVPKIGLLGDTEGARFARYLRYQDLGTWNYIETRKGELSVDGLADRQNFEDAWNARCR